MNNNNKKTHRQYKLTSGIYIFFVVIILLLVNLIANLFPYKFDFSANKTFSLSDESKYAIDTINQDVEILLCQDRANFSKNKYLSNIAETAESIGNYSKNITVTFKSIDKNPEIAKEYPSTGLATTSVIVRRIDDHQKYKVLSVSNFFETDQNTGAITQSRVEYLIISAMDFVCRDSFPGVLFIDNHVEDYPEAFASLLSGNNYQIDTVNLLTNDIPTNIDYVMICNPKIDYSNEEISKLDAFLQNNGQLGKSLYVFMSPEQAVLPNFESFLKEWGIEVKTGYLYNTKYALDSSYQPMLSDFSDVNSAGNLYRTVKVVTYQTRPLNLLFDTRDYQTTTSLLTTASGAQYVQNSDLPINIETDAPANYPILAVGNRMRKNSSTESHLIVSGSYKLISDSYINSTYGNSEYFMQIVNYFSDNSSNFIIYPKNMESPILTFNNTSSQTIMFVLFIIVIPLAVAVIGTVIFIKRRHL